MGIPGNRKIGRAEGFVLFNSAPLGLVFEESKLMDYNKNQ